MRAVTSTSNIELNTPKGNTAFSAGRVGVTPGTDLLFVGNRRDKTSPIRARYRMALEQLNAAESRCLSRCRLFQLEIIPTARGDTFKGWGDQVRLWRIVAHAIDHDLVVHFSGDAFYDCERRGTIVAPLCPSITVIGV